MDVIAIALCIIFGGTIIGIFATKTPGFGRYTTSVLLLVLVLFVAALSFVLGKIESQPLLNILFTIVGYAGGLIMGHKNEKSN